MRADEMRVGAYRLRLGNPHGAKLERDAGALSETAPATEPAASPPPVHPAGLIDRHRERAQIVSLLRAHRAVRVFGTPGIGTTTVVRQIAARLPDETLPDGSFYLHEAGHAVDDLLTRLWQLRFAAGAARKPLREELRSALEPLRALVALDGTALSQEQLATFASFVPNSHVLVAATGTPVSGQDPAQISLLPLEANDGVVLLEETLRRPIYGPERGAAAAICRHAGGIPALIRCIGAASRDGGQSLAEVATAIADREGLTRFAQSALTTITRDEQTIVSLLAATGTTIAGGLIEAITGIAKFEDAAAALQRREVVVRDGENYALVSGIAPFVPPGWAALLDVERVVKALHRPLADGTGHPMSGQQSALLLRVLEITVAASRWPTVISFGIVASKALALAGRWEAWTSALEHVRSAAGRANDKPAVAWALHELGARAVALGESEARTLLEEALALRTKLRDRAGAGATRALLELAAPVPTPAERSVPASVLQHATDGEPSILADKTYLDNVRKNLAKYIGPIATQVVADAANDARSKDQFFEICVQDLTQKERERFLASVNDL